MYRQPSKQKILIQRIVVYSLMTVSVVGLVVVLAFVMLGYQFNGNDGKIEQGGLVQFDSQPSGATVTIDGVAFGTRTASKTTVASGQHTVEMQLKGYEKWQKSINVIPGSVSWLNYTRFIPTEKKVSDVADFAPVTSVITTKDDKKMAIKEDAATPAVSIADLTSEDVKVTQLTFPETSYTHSDDAAQQFHLESWDPDGRYMVIKHVYGGSVEWLVVDSQNAMNTKNVTTLLGVQASRVVFSNNDDSILYALIDGSVRKINVHDATLSRPLVTNVASFDLYGDSMITYVTMRDSASGSRSVGYYVDGVDTPRVVKTIIDGGEIPLQFTVGRYFSDTFEAISYGDTIEILKGDLPRDTTSKIDLKHVDTASIAGGAQYLSDHTDGRFIVAQHGAQYVTYDLELGKATTTNLKGTASVTSELQWLDNYTVWSDQDGMLRSYEFDGANQHDLMTVVPGMSVSLSPNDKYLYGITRSDDSKYHLSRLHLVAAKNE